LSHVECNLLRVMNKGDSEHLPKFAVAYVRAATGQIPPDKIREQLEVMRDYASRHGLEIVGEYSEMGENEKQG
jgi:hypothetical protein